MHKNHFAANAVVLLSVACFIWAGSWTGLPARAQHAGHDAGEHQARQPAEHQPDDTARAPAASRGAHGGQVTQTASYCLEVVYRPQEIRVYLYESSMRPVTARGVQGRVAMKAQGQQRIVRLPLRYVAPAAGSREQDYLAAKVDVSRVRDGSMTVTFELADLPHPKEPQASFTQEFALSEIPLKVTLAALTRADQAGIARQKVCPVTGTELGGHGTPVKVLIGDRPVYLCCKGCLEKVQKDPELYLRKVYPPDKATSGGRITVTAATAADRAAIQAQGVCPVTNAPLGSMGTPVKVTIDGQDIFLCCRGCLGKVRGNPEHYFHNAAPRGTGPESPGPSPPISQGGK